MRHIADRERQDRRTLGIGDIAGLLAQSEGVSEKSEVSRRRLSRDRPSLSDGERHRFPEAVHSCKLLDPIVRIEEVRAGSLQADEVGHVRDEHDAVVSGRMP